MSSKKKLVKSALESPELYAPAELSFFELWLRKRKEKKEAKKREKRGGGLPLEQDLTINLNQEEPMTTTTEDGDRQNVFAKEPPVYTDPTYTESHNVKAERLNGQLAMLGVIAALGAYAVSGQLIPGIW